MRRGCITDLLSQIGLKLLQINPWCHLLLERIPLKLMCTNQVLHFCYKWNPVRKPACSLKLRSSCRLVWWKRNLSTSILKEKQQLTKLICISSSVKGRSSKTEKISGAMYCEMDLTTYLESSPHFKLGVKQWCRLGARFLNNHLNPAQYHE